MKKEENIYKIIFDNAPVAITLTDEKERITSWNKFTESLYRRKDLKNLPVSSLYPKEEWQRIRKADIRKKGLQHHFETKIKRKDNSLVDVDISISVIKENKKIAGSIGIARDITERKKSEKEVEYEKDLLHALMDNIPDSIYFKDLESRFTRINKAKSNKLKLKDPRDAVGKTDFDFYQKGFAEDALKDEKEILRSGEPIIGKIEKIKKPTGQYRWVSATKVPIKDKDKRTIGLVGISRDITEQKEAEERLRMMRNELEERVGDRTRELENVNKELKRKIQELERAEFALRRSIKK